MDTFLQMFIVPGIIALCLLFLALRRLHEASNISSGTIRAGILICSFIAGFILNLVVRGIYILFIS